MLLPLSQRGSERGWGARQLLCKAWLNDTLGLDYSAYVRV